MDSSWSAAARVAASPHTVRVRLLRSGPSRATAVPLLPRRQGERSTRAYPASCPGSPWCPRSRSGRPAFRARRVAGFWVRRAVGFRAQQAAIFQEQRAVGKRAPLGRLVMLHVTAGRALALFAACLGPPQQGRVAEVEA